jgi:hypothetical protein
LVDIGVVNRLARCLLDSGGELANLSAVLLMRRRHVQAWALL